MARKRALEEQARAEARTAFGGSIFVARYTYTYGWREYGVYAKNADHARTLVNEWFRSGEGQEESIELYEDAIDDYQCYLDEYLEYARDSSYGEALLKPEKPKKRDFSLTMDRIAKSERDASDYEIEEVLFVDQGGRWDHDLFEDSKS